MCAFCIFNKKFIQLLLQVERTCDYLIVFTVVLFFLGFVNLASTSLFQQIQKDLK